MWFFFVVWFGVTINVISCSAKDSNFFNWFLFCNRKLLFRALSHLGRLGLMCLTWKLVVLIDSITFLDPLARLITGWLTQMSRLPSHGTLFSLNWWTIRSVSPRIGSGFMGSKNLILLAIWRVISMVSSHHLCFPLIFVLENIYPLVICFYSGSIGDINIVLIG